MKIIMKFKDGMSVVNDFSGQDILFSGSGNILELMLKGKEANGDINITDNKTGQEVKRKYSDLYSLEVVFAD